MNRKTLYALLACAGLGVLSIIALTRPQKGERVSDHPRPVAKINTADVETIEVTKAGATTIIKSDGGKYSVTAPVPYAADEAVCKAAFEGLGKMDVSDLVTEQKTKQAEFEVDDKSGIHLVAKAKGGKVLADVIVGKSNGPGTMVRPSGKDEVWQAAGISRYLFDKAPADWRDKSITTFALADAEKVEVAAKDGGKTIVKKTGAKVGSDDAWEVVESSVKIDKLDNAVPNGIASALSIWKTNDFADSEKPPTAGLEPPALTVTVDLKGGKKATVLIGNKKGDDEFYVKTPESPQVFVVKKYNLDRVMKRPVEFRDKTLCDIADGDVTEIAVTHDPNSFTIAKTGSEWKASKPAKFELDSSKVTFATAFKEWKAQSFAEDATPKTNGLAKPQGTIVAKGKGKTASCTIKVGDETKDKLNYYVMSSKGSDVYLAPKWNVDRVMVKLDDIKKGSGGGAPPNPQLAAKPNPHKK
ncbi:MAG TPA: DUF4340 domain-containing protein [Polyangia bacterium]|jgi:hypothetical protein|nr:DUF4340 domain-containing protein [Polyangia bacterium]